METRGTCRNATPTNAPTLSDSPALAPCRAFPATSERIECSQPSRRGEIDRHDHYRHDGKRGSKRDIAGGALQLVHRLADEWAGVADDARNDVVAQGQRESKYGARHNARKRQRQDDLAEG